MAPESAQCSCNSARGPDKSSHLKTDLCCPGWLLWPFLVIKSICFQEAKTCRMEKEWDGDGSFPGGPALPSSAGILSSHTLLIQHALSLHRASCIFYFLPFLPVSPQVSCHSPFSVKIYSSLPPAHLRFNSKSFISLCYLEPESEWRHNTVSVEREPQSVSSQTSLGMENSAPDSSPGPRLQLCSIPQVPGHRNLGCLNWVLLTVGWAPGFTNNIRLPKIGKCWF